jgi:uncharacterized protein (DUF1684 family)
MSTDDRRITGFRERKDTFFKENEHSPLSEEQKAAFTGLSYFPTNPDR